ncbi:hypothetical protein [Alteribacter lacisalsi]|uniref:hypothetical protein n=1 Tax=Alteribacter lacisalsi TaxID=2045244 RepID=UPI00191BEFBA|nr:hypothetical protein [Alteribacter lacisalsi]
MNERNVPFQNDQYPAAELNEETLNELQAFESRLRAETGRDVLLIAYEDQNHEPK